MESSASVTAAEALLTPRPASSLLDYHTPAGETDACGIPERFAASAADGSVGTIWRAPFSIWTPCLRARIDAQRLPRPFATQDNTSTNRCI